MASQLTELLPQKRGDIQCTMDYLEEPRGRFARGALTGGYNVMPTPKQVLENWYWRVTVAQRAHYLSAQYFGARKYWLGIPAVVLATLVGTSVFATVQKQPVLWLQICVGLASVAAALLSSLQTFLGYAERAEKHRIAGAKYAALGRELEQLRSLEETPSEEAMSEVRKRLDDLAVESPNNPISIYRRAGADSLPAGVGSGAGFEEAKPWESHP
jgi:hypothetical protein